MIKIFKTEEEWLKAKEETIGGTAISSILGLNPYESAIDLYHKIKGITPREEINDAMKRGIYLEEGVNKWFLSDYENAKDIYPKKDGIPFFIHPDLNFLTSSPDQVAIFDGYAGRGMYLNETKTTIKLIQDISDIPTQWICQLNWNIGLGRLNGLDIIGGYFIILTAVGFNLVPIPFDFDEELFELQLSSAIEFKELLDTDTLPEPKTESDYNSILTEDNSKIHANVKVLEYLQNLKKTKDEIDQLEKYKTFLGLQIRKYMGAKERLVMVTGADEVKLCSYTSGNKTTLNKTKLKKDMPELYMKYTITTYTRQLRPVYNNL